MLIVPLQQNEINEAAGVIATIFSEKWRSRAQDEFVRLFKGEAHPTYIFVAKADDKIIGLAGCMETYFSEGIYSLCWVGVLEEFRKQGIAERLIGQAESFVKTDLLQGKPGTIILAADKIDYYMRLNYISQVSALHDGAHIMQKIVNN